MRPAPAAPATDRTEIDLANLEDRTLIDLSRGGDLDAFNVLVTRYQNAVYGVALKMVRNPATAEDLAQDTFISAFRNIARFRGGNFRAWLLRIARNATYDHLRRMKRRPETSIEENIVAFSDTFRASDPEPEAWALTSELGRAITEGLGTLSDDHRMSIILVDMDGYRYEEAAEVMGVSVGTVKSRLNRARGRMRDFLKTRPELLPDEWRL